MPATKKVLDILIENRGRWTPTEEFIRRWVLHPHSAMTVLRRRGWEIDTEESTLSTTNKYKLTGRWLGKGLNLEFVPADAEDFLKKAGIR